jgi:hypothetical protein
VLLPAAANVGDVHTPRRGRRPTDSGVTSFLYDHRSLRKIFRTRPARQGMKRRRPFRAALVSRDNLAETSSTRVAQATTRVACDAPIVARHEPVETRADFERPTARALESPCPRTVEVPRPTPGHPRLLKTRSSSISRVSYVKTLDRPRSVECPTSRHSIVCSNRRPSARTFARSGARDTERGRVVAIQRAIATSAARAL